VRSATEIAFRLHGLEFARARVAAESADRFRNAERSASGLVLRSMLSAENEEASRIRATRGLVKTSGWKAG